MNKQIHSLTFYLFIFLFSLFTSLSLSSCDDLFQDKIPMSGRNDTLNGLFARNADGVKKLSTPVQFDVVPYSSSQIRLSWNRVSDASYYMIERAVSLYGEEPDDGDYEPIERFEYSISYVDEILKAPKLDSPEFMNEYFYRVSAFNTAQKFDESEPTIPESARLFRAPVNVKASGGTSEFEIKIQWELTPGANSYEIFRSPLASGASASSIGIAMGNQREFTNLVSAAEQGVDYYYIITAKNTYGSISPQTRPAYGYARVSGAPDTPAKIQLADDSGRGRSLTGIKIKWDAVADAAYYAVYRYSETDSSLTRLTGNTTETEWFDTQGLKPGVYYYYKIQAIREDVSSGKELKSQFSPDGEAEGFLLSSPTEVIAEKNSDGSITVKWKPAKGNEGERSSYTYNVYKGSSMEGKLTSPAATSVSPYTDTEGYISASFSVTDTPSYTFFRVTTLNGGNESEQSIVVSPSPAAAIIQDASRHANTSVSANSNGVYPVKITWKKPENETPAFYTIQRSTRTGSGFSRINDVSLPAEGPWSNEYYREGDIYTYIDKNESARVARKYYYRVLSLNQLEQGSFPSDEKIGWGALTHNQYLLEYNKTMSSALRKLTLMYKGAATDKLGTETKYGSLGGSIYYNAAMQGVGARIIIQLSNYADFYIENVAENGVYFTLNGNSNTTANMSSNGSMDGTVTCSGMYPGSVSYDRIEIKGGGAGGGTYGVQPDGFPRAEVTYTLIN